MNKQAEVAVAWMRDPVSLAHFAAAEISALVAADVDAFAALVFDVHQIAEGVRAAAAALVISRWYWEDCADGLEALGNPSSDTSDRAWGWA